VNTAIVVNHEDAPVPLIVGAVHTLLSFVIFKFKEACGLAHPLYVADDRFSTRYPSRARERS
jgi:hypothetical protein